MKKTHVLSQFCPQGAQTIIFLGDISAIMGLNIEKVGPSFSSFNPCPSLSFIERGDRKQSRCLNNILLHFFKNIQILKFKFSQLTFYTCQLFLRCRREIFILGVLGFLKTTPSFPKIPEEVRSLPKTSEVCRRRSYRENAYPQNQRSRGRYCHLFILHMVFVPYMGLS